MSPLFALLLALLATAWAPSTQAREQPEPKLSIQGSDRSVSFTRAELLARPDVETVTIADDPAYPGRTMTYKAVPVAALFRELRMDDDAVVQFKCLDGFSAPISKERLLNQSATASRGYVAVEPRDAPWPPLKPDGPSAGPFYLVWPKPELSAIGREEWPFQLSAFEIKGKLAAVYPEILPDPKLKADDPVRLGFASFTRNCFACHTLNKAGAAEIGPDLNVPMNPTEYFTASALRKLIRDPQSVRHFPKSRMNGFGPGLIPEAELTQLIAYLEHMAKRR